MTPRSPDPAHDRRAKQDIEALARLLDSQFRLPGTQRRFGLDGLLGLVPGIGDVAGLVLSAGVIAKAIGLGARGATVGRMVGNVALDAAVGTIPVIGWVFDFVFKANTRNVALLERHTLDPHGTEAESRATLVRTLLVVVIAVVVLVAALLALVAWLLSLLL